VSQRLSFCFLLLYASDESGECIDSRREDRQLRVKSNKAEAKEWTYDAIPASAISERSRR